MDYKVSKPTAEMIDALRTVSDLWDKVYSALSKVYSEDDVTKMMNGGLKDEPGGFMRAEQAMSEEIHKLLVTLIEANLDDEEKKGFIQWGYSAYHSINPIENQSLTKRVHENVHEKPKC